MGKVYTKDQLKKLSDEEVEKLFNNYEAKLSGQMVKSLGHSIINMYSMGACAALRISNQDALSEDLENDPFLNYALQRFTCELYYRFGSFLAPLSAGIITSRHYLSECNKMENEQVEKMKTSKNSSTSSKNVATELTIGAAMVAQLMVGFWFAIGAIFAVKIMNGLEYCSEELISR